MRQLIILCVVAGIVAAAPLFDDIRVSSVHTRQTAAKYGVILTEFERYDPWTGLKTDTSLKPTDSADQQLVTMTLARMRESKDPCARIVARFIAREKTVVSFAIIQDSPNHPSEAAYSNNEITINEGKLYLRHPNNLTKKLIHESFHRVQDILRLNDNRESFHAYAHRPNILSYLHKEFSKEGICVLPQVPEGIRNTVADTVVILGGFSPMTPPRPPYFAPPRLATPSRIPLSPSLLNFPALEKLLNKSDFDGHKDISIKKPAKN